MMLDLMEISVLKDESVILPSISWGCSFWYGSHVRICQIVMVAHNCAMNSTKLRHASKKYGRIVPIVAILLSMSRVGVDLSSKSSRNYRNNKDFRFNQSGGLSSAHLHGSTSNDD